MKKYLRNMPFREMKALAELWPFIHKQKKIFIVSLALMPMISLLQFAQPLLLKKSIDEGIVAENTEVLLQFSIFFFVIILLEYGVRSLQLLCSAIVVQKMLLQIRKKLTIHIFNLAPHYHDKIKSGSLVTRMTNDCDNLSESINSGVLQSVVDLFVLIGSIISMFMLDVYLALCVIISVPFSLYLIFGFTKLIKRSLTEARKNLADLNAFTQECFSGITTIKVLTAEKKVGDQYKKLNLRFRNSQMKAVTFDAVLFSIIEGMVAIFIGFVLWMIISQTLNDRSYTPGLIVAFIRCIQQVFDPLKQLGSALTSLQGVLTSLERIMNILRIKETIKGTEEIPELKGEIVFDHVNFAYNPGSFILKQANFSCSPGTFVALMGKTGEGKSTVTRLLTKLYDGYSGKITLDGYDLKELDPWMLRKKMAIVPQEITLFQGTIAFNIGLDREEATITEIKRVAGIVGAHSFIEQLEGQYNFIVSENGANLSEGEKQLLIFARALIGDNKFLLLDEATASVDPQAERQIQKSLERIVSGRTVVIIAHRMETIQLCHKILKVEDKKIRQQTMASLSNI